MGAFDTDILAYQGAGDYVHAGGLELASWADNSEVGTQYKYYLTIIDAGAMRRIRQTGYVYSAKASFHSIATNSTVSFIVLRLNGTNYDLISQSEAQAIPGTGTQTYTFSTPISCQIGDCFGAVLYNPAVEAKPQINVKYIEGGNVPYKWANVSASNTLTNLANYALDVEAFTHRPYVCGTGDSIMGGSTEYLSFYDTFSGTPTHNPLVQLALLNTNIQHQNHSNTGETFDWCRTTGVVSALATNPKYLIIHAGINDLYNGWTWALVESDLNAIKTLCDTAGAVLILDEILPWTNGSDAQAVTLRTWNGNLATWCTTNGVHLILMHDTFGQIRPSTGQLDDLKDEYDSDGVHVTLAGKQKMAELWNSYFSSLYPDGSLLKVNFNAGMQNMSGGIHG